VANTRPPLIADVRAGSYSLQGGEGAYARRVKALPQEAKWNGSGWDVTLSDGTVYVFGVTKPLQAIRDRHPQGGQMK
jgi:hypothetical protein